MVDLLPEDAAKESSRFPNEYEGQRAQCGGADSANHQFLTIMNAVEALRIVKTFREQEISDPTDKQSRSKYANREAVDA